MLAVLGAAGVGVANVVNAEGQTRQEVAAVAQGQLGEQVTAQGGGYTNLSGGGEGAVTYRLMSQQTGALIGLATLVHGDPATAVEICPVNALEFDAALESVTAGRTIDLQLVCTDGQWGVQAQPAVTQRQLVGVTNKTSVFRTITVPKGLPRQAGPAFDAGRG